MRFRSQEDEKMSSVQCLHRLLFSISLLLSITISASFTIVPSLPVSNSAQKYAEAWGNSTATTEISPSFTHSSTITKMISPSPTLNNSPDLATDNTPDTATVDSADMTTTDFTDLPRTKSTDMATTDFNDMATTDSTDMATTDFTDMATSDSTGKATTDSTDMATTDSTDMAITDFTDMATTDSTDMATTLLPVTTDVTQSIGLTTTANSPTSQTQFIPLVSSTSVPISQSAQTTLMAMSVSTPTETINITGNFKTQEPPLALSHSEASITIFFGVMLGVTILIIAGYSIHRCNLRKSLYIHQPLYNSSEETGDGFSAPEDTLVISGGLYDGPEIFNPALTTDEDMGLSLDQPAFAPQLTQFRLELLSEAQLNSPGSGAHAMETSQSFDAKD